MTTRTDNPNQELLGGKLNIEVILEDCMSLKLSNIFVSPWYSPLHLGLSHPQVTYNNRGCAFISLQALRIMFS